jgi:hypothetical protein
MIATCRRNAPRPRPDAFNHAWDNSFEPALEIESGETILLHVEMHQTSRSARPQRRTQSQTSTSARSIRSAARSSSRALEPETRSQSSCPEFEPPDSGDAIIPGFGLLADEFSIRGFDL